MLAILLYMDADQCSSPRRLVVRYAVAESMQINLDPALVQHPYPISHYWYHCALTQCQIDLHFTAKCKKLHLLYSNSLPVSLNKIWLGHKIYPYAGLDKPLGLQEFEDPRISRQSARRWQGLNAEDIAGTNFFWVNLKAILRPEGLCQWKITIQPSGIETAAFWLVVQFLKATV
jgi:hypothetical protein